VPELPEVQTVVDDLLAADVVGATITSARVYWPRTVEGLSPQAFRRRLVGLAVTAIRRRGKFIVLDFTDGRHLLIHLRMTGHLELSSPAVNRSRHQHVILGLGPHRELRFSDPRKFGRFYLADNAGAMLDRLGPEPLAPAFTSRILHARLRSRRRVLKPLLLDQRFIAGLGNIYVDEALWEARLHPARRSDSLDGEESRALHRAIRKVLRRGLKNLGTTLGSGRTTFYSVGRRPGRNRDQLRVFRRTGAPCPRCRGLIVRIVLGQRSTHLCPSCQRSVP
jgi:formamidopyrimidine-DNA glycosylase